MWHARIDSDRDELSKSEVTRTMVIRQRLLAILGLMAVLSLAPFPVRAAVVIMDGTLNYTTMFGRIASRDVDFYGTRR